MRTVKRISSSDNTLLKGINKLKRKKDRDREGLYLIEGFNLTNEALNTNSDLKLVIFRESLFESDNSRETENLIKKLEQNGVDTYVLTNNVFDRISDTQTPQGILSVVRKKEWSYSSFFNKDTCDNILVLDRLQDPGNVGTVIRTADAAGYQGVIVLKGTVDVYSMKVVRAAAGSIFRIPLMFIDTPEEAVDILKRNGKFIISTTPYCDRYYFENEMKHDVALVIGNEGGGISNALLQQSDLLVKIPMRNAVESLNVAVASGIVIYETVRQKYEIKDGGRI